MTAKQRIPKLLILVKKDFFNTSYVYLKKISYWLKVLQESGTFRGTNNYNKSSLTPRSIFL